MSGGVGRSAQLFSVELEFGGCAEERGKIISKAQTLPQRMDGICKKIY